MPKLHQFRPTFYMVLALGLTGFCIAIEAPGLWVLTLAGLALHLWLVHTGRFRPMPRLLANGITLFALAYTFHVIRTVPTPIIAIGQFLVLLQGVKLFEMRANRDQAQLLVLSLLLMVAGAISTAALAFGVLMVLYLFVALYCCLLFHLKVENEQAVAAQTLPSEKLDAATVRQDQRFLGRSMKKLAGLVAIVAIAMAVIVFVFFPRGAGAGMFGQLQFRPGQALTGFSDQVSFGQISSIGQNNEIVANIIVYRNGRPIEGTQTLYLRGKTLDSYSRADRQWNHRPPLALPREMIGSAEVSMRLVPEPMVHQTGDDYLQVVSLRPTGGCALFTLANPIAIVPGRDVGRLRYNREDQTLESHAPLYQRLDYQVLSRDSSEPIPTPFRPLRFADDAERIAWFGPRIMQYARRPEVCGVDEQGRALASLRPAGEFMTDLDERIATNIERHLRTRFEYTLDLPAVATIDPVQDPVEQFLFDWKKGHCEYFASAMVLLLQCQGIPARMVTGFKCDEYDPGMGQYYIVRKSHAHAWVEVRTASGWKRFDPTSGTLAAGPSRSAWQTIKHFFNFLEFKWATGVIAYDADRRENLISSLERTAGETAARQTGRLGRLWAKLAGWFEGGAEIVRDWLSSGQGQIVSSHLMIGLAAIVIALSLLRLGSWLLRRWRMRQRAQRFGLEHLPVAQRLRLARQLGFYERLVRLLEERRIVRRAHQTPAEFGRSLIYLPARAYDAVRDLTEIFYAVRFGGRELTDAEQRDLESQVQALPPML